MTEDEAYVRLMANERDRNWVEAVIAKAKAEVYRSIAKAVRAGHRPAWRGMGGPQDGDDEPERFDVSDVIRYLEAEAELADPTAAEDDA